MGLGYFELFLGLRSPVLGGSGDFRAVRRYNVDLYL